MSWHVTVSMNLSPFMTGNLLLAMSIGLIIGSPICGWISDSILRSRKYVIIAGLAMMAGILITLAVLPIDTGLLILFALFWTKSANLMSVSFLQLR